MTVSPVEPGGSPATVPPDELREDSVSRVELESDSAEPGASRHDQDYQGAPNKPQAAPPRPDHQRNKRHGAYLDVTNAGSSHSSSSDSLVSAHLLPPNTVQSEPVFGEPVSPSPSPAPELTAASPPPKLAWKQKITRTWLLGKGMLMVMSAQFFGASMNVMTRLLELNGPHGKGMHPFEILFVRMSATTFCSFLYMWYTRVPQPFGAPDVRGLLVLRGVSGFIGVFGLYYSLGYLPLSEATVLTFLAPILTCYVCSLIMPNETFTRKQQLAGIASLLGVVLIARPTSLFSSIVRSSAEGIPPYSNTTSLQSPIAARNAIVGKSSTGPDSDSTQHLIAIGAALVGVLGATSAYTSIRKIGQRAHPLVSVNYFSTLTTIISTIAVLVLPNVSFRLPANVTETLLLCGLGICGFFLQFLLTAGLSYVPPPSVVGGNGAGSGKGSSHGSRATNMVYTQMLFALFYDRMIWNSMPSALSWAGSGIILASAIYVAIARDGNRESILANVKHEGEEEESADGILAGARGDDLESGTARAKVVFRNDGCEAVDEEERRSLLHGHENDNDDDDYGEGERAQEYTLPR
ncbi:hypothetical protein D8B26_006803 [Coccidioides posadasii str. Silveira]|uniref:Uncharacterized protein n=1 Tax=Coccidioides posadasii (strain RMSCC 757 / Silveira) TaxID=443226 RepID=E9CRT4_COCPS|nr:conserved hypothetical protein [Coccidioides posadasii str. Silveira]QVM12168.1 hypothetical protein D8B26_006803 [Coccidioides posadasii str. Silveira]